MSANSKIGEPEPVRIFVSCRKSEIVRSRLIGPASVRCSNPPYNRFEQPEVKGWEKFSNVDVPAYSAAVKSELYKLLTSERVATVLEKHGIPIPQYSFSWLYHGRIAKVYPLVQALIDRNLDESAQRLNAFLKAAETRSADNIRSCAEWMSFMSGFFPDDWQTRLSYDKIGGLFGISDQISTELRRLPYENTTMERWSYRWLSKVMDMWTIDISLADPINYIAAALNCLDDQARTLSEQEIIEMIKRFCEALDKDPQSLWVPDEVHEDEEGDDNVMLGLIYCLNPNVRVHAYVPLDGVYKTANGELCRYDFTSLTQRLSKSRSSCTRDPQASNAMALQRYHPDTVTFPA